jgi:hypothetical protein
MEYTFRIYADRLIGRVLAPLRTTPTDGRTIHDMPDDPVGRDRTPKPAVHRFTTIVAQHEPVAGWNLDRCGKIAHRT